MNNKAPKIVTSKELLLMIKEKHKLPSTYALAKILKIPHKSARLYLGGELIKQGRLMVRISELLDTDLNWVAYNIMAEEAEKDGENDVAQSFLETAQQYAPIGLAISACFCLFFLPLAMPF